MEQHVLRDVARRAMTKIPPQAVRRWFSEMEHDRRASREHHLPNRDDGVGLQTIAPLGQPAAFPPKSIRTGNRDDLGTRAVQQRFGSLGERGSEVVPTRIDGRQRPNEVGDHTARPLRATGDDRCIEQDSHPLRIGAL
jgi:hypothetical protein